MIGFKMRTLGHWLHNPKITILSFLGFVVLLMTVAYQQQYTHINTERQALDTTTQLIHFSRAVSDFVHESQKERGLSAGLIGSSGQHFSEQLSEQRARTDQTYTTLLAAHTHAVIAIT
jgi:S-methylmethionine-dependent homocysteine/selenocysteine methylase